MTEDEAIRWLTLIRVGRSSGPEAGQQRHSKSGVRRPWDFLKFGTCLLFDLPENNEAARKWLAAVTPRYRLQRRAAIGDRKAVVTLALGARGLKRLGLPEQGLATFPFAFLDGMTTPARARILGDVDRNSSEHWAWGRTQPDVALLVYGDEPDFRRRPGAACHRSCDGLPYGKAARNSSQDGFGRQGGAVWIRRRNFAAGDPRDLQGIAQCRSNSPGGTGGIYPWLSGQPREYRRRGQRCRLLPIRTICSRSLGLWAASTRPWWKTTATSVSMEPSW